MIVATGKSILKGIAIGKIKFLKKAQAEIKDTAADPPQAFRQSKFLQPQTTIERT